MKRRHDSVSHLGEPVKSNDQDENDHAGTFVAIYPSGYPQLRMGQMELTAQESVHATTTLFRDFWISRRWWTIPMNQSSRKREMAGTVRQLKSKVNLSLLMVSYR
jgi:hypothetical protein